MGICRHPKLIEVDGHTLIEYNSEGQLGNVIGGFNWKKYICDECGNMVTVLSAVVEKYEKEKEI